MQRVTVVILDLDNTLFDWVEIWCQSFRAMLDELVQHSGIEREILLSDFKAVFTRHATSEYAFAISVPNRRRTVQSRHATAFQRNLADVCWTLLRRWVPISSGTMGSTATES